MSATTGRRVGNPLALVVSPVLWGSLGYLAAYVLLGALWFAVALAAVIVGGVLTIFVVGVPVLLAGLALVRAAAEVERVRVPAALGGPIARPYRAVRPTLRQSLADRLRDPATGRDLVFTILLWPVLLALDVVALSVWLTGWALVSLPLWYRFIPNTFDDNTKGHGVSIGYNPNGWRHGPHDGWFVHDTRSALLTAALGVVIVLLVGNYAVAGVGKLQSAIARGLLGPTGRAPQPAPTAEYALVA